MQFKDNKAIYLQIVDRICDSILNGCHPEGSRIPSVREYAATVEVNANTVARSFDYLQSREIIYNRRGIGYFVSAQARATIKEMRKREFIDGDLPELFRKMSLLGISIDEIIENYNNQHK